MNAYNGPFGEKGKGFILTQSFEGFRPRGTYGSIVHCSKDMWQKELVEPGTKQRENNNPLKEVESPVT